MKQVATDAAEISASIKAEVNNDGNSIVPTSVANPPSSDLDEDTDNKLVKFLNYNEPVNASSEE